ncbi:MAG: hypothetical protein HN356_10585 [Calditrichaeota bacterium]|nr:hypothetical protein [Calditrichota bacterium]
MTLIDASYTFTNTIVNELIVTEGAEIQLNGVNALTVRDSLIIPGTLDNPVTVRSLNPNSRSRFVVEGRYHAYVDIQHTNFSDAIEVDFEIDSLKIRHTQFDGEVSFEGNVVIDSCIFQDQVLLTSWQYMRVKRSIFKNGIDIGGDVRDGELMNNNIVGAQYDGIILHRFSNFRILNNIIANNRGGVNNRFHEQPELLYNCVYGNSDDNWLGCERGQGSISVDPRMVNYQRFEYDLIEDSPCIDAGDPSSPLDPDETRADIGAHYFDHEPWSIDEAPVPDEFHISTFPNPFNSSLRVSISNP